MGVLTVIMGVILVVCGFGCIFTPGLAFLGSSVFLGIVLLIDGIEMIVLYCTRKKDLGAQTLAGGIIFTLLGLLLLCSLKMRFLTDVVIIYCFAIGVIINGVVSIAFAMKMKKLGANSWGWKLGFGILTILLGIYCFVHPLVSAMTIGCLIGFIIVVQGFQLIGVGTEIKD